METNTALQAAKRINVTSTAYEGDDFPEAERYADWVADRLADIYPGHEITVSEGLGTKAFVYGSEVDPHEVQSLVGADLWEEFCESGYKQFSEAQ